MKKVALLVLSLLVLYVLYTLWSTGTFRSIKNTEGIEVLKSYTLPGTEDITISRKDNFAIISSTNRSEFPAKTKVRGELYYLDLNNEDAQPISLTQSFSKDFAPHGISLFPVDSSYIVAAISHVEGKHFVEMFRLQGLNLSHIRTIQDPMMISPNDLVLMDQNTFYITNDHKYPTGFMKVIEDYGGLAISNVLHYDGAKFKEVADGISYSNGINYNPESNLLFVASSRGFKVKVFEVQPSNDLTPIEDIYCGTGVDNIEFDEDMNLWIGAHPDLIHFASYNKNKKTISPSEVIKINYEREGKTTVTSLLVNDGSMMSGCSVATPFRERLLLGNVKDRKLVVTKLNHQ